MTVLDMINTILIGPLKLVFEVLFSAAYKAVGDPGVCIVFLSLAMNVLVLPLYRRADAIQTEVRNKEIQLKDTVKHIKKTFSGNERMMILQTYYRQNQYSSFAALKGSLSLLLQIPFFMAAYQFLSNLDLLQGVAFGVIADLGKPDGLLTVGALSINILPFIMTLVNIASGSFYSKGFPLKSKIQLYAMAVVFLVLLYNSPSALVLYWTLNNIFSFMKNLLARTPNGRAIINSLLCVVGSGALLLGIGVVHPSRSAFWISLGVISFLPCIIALVKKKWPGILKAEADANPNKMIFLLGTVFLTLLVGLLIPSTYIAASPQEYIEVGYFYHPIWYVVNTLCLSAGTFLVWFNVFYWLAKNTGKKRLSQLMWIGCGILLMNYMFFGTNLGIVSPDLLYTDGFSFALAEKLINTAAIVAAAVVLWWIFRKISKRISTVLLGGALALLGMSSVNIVSIMTVTQDTKQQIMDSADEMPSFTLSKEGKNVVVIMLDRGINQFIPYIMEENPVLRAQFDGFTHYANSLAYGAKTIFTTPALFGGFDYTPVNLNLRDDEYLVDKHNEALKVLPTLFSQEGFDVTLIDPSYAGYTWIPDLSVFDNMDGVTAYHAESKFKSENRQILDIQYRQRNFFFFSLMKTMPVTFQPVMYDYGLYCDIPSKTNYIDPEFTDAYEVMTRMEDMTRVINGDSNTYMFLRSLLTHSPEVLQEPFYEPAVIVDNSAYYSEIGKIITDGEDSRLLSTENQISHYHVNMASLIQLGKWFDYLRENDVYDNTRIIVVSDHGRDLGVFDTDFTSSLYDIEFYQAMLLVKDFDAHGFTTVEDFMTNADVPALAMEGLIEDPVNPFTHNPINDDYKTENEKQHVILSREWDTTINNGKQFLESGWATVSGDVRNKENWEFNTKWRVLPADFTE